MSAYRSEASRARLLLRSMFASEFALPASEHLCNRLLEGDAIDRMVPQLVVSGHKV